MAESLAGVLRCAASLEEARIPHVLVTLIAVRGSVPQDLSAKMVVGREGRAGGTVGGGKIEAAALVRAAELLAEGVDTTCVEEWDLKKDIGMTCGGAASLLFEVRASRPWTIAIFGAGHVVQTLVDVLLPLPALIEVRDPRADWIAQLPSAPNFRAFVEAEPAGSVAGLAAGAFVLCITQGHQTDFPILEKALRRGDFAFVGAIGSRSKAATLRRELREAGVSDAAIAALQCPLGLELGSNHPQEIAISIAAQLLLKRDRSATKP